MYRARLCIGRTFGSSPRVAALMAMLTSSEGRLLATLDIEASSLGEFGYPIEVGFVLGNSRGIICEFASLIKPRPQWTRPGAWSAESEAVHGIAQETLCCASEADVICNLLDSMLGDLEVVVDGGSYDTYWLDALYHGRNCKFSLDHLTGIDPGWFSERKRKAAPQHRALADARWLWKVIAEQRFPAT